MKNIHHLTITLPAVSGIGGHAGECELTIALPWYWRDVTEHQFRDICQRAFPPILSDRARDPGSEFGGALRDVLHGLSVYTGRAALIASAVRRLHATCSLSDNPAAALYGFLRHGATPIQIEE